MVGGEDYSIASTIKIGNGPNQSSITPSEMEFQISNHSGCNKCPPNDGIVKDQTNDERRCQFGLQSHVFYALFIKCLNKKKPFDIMIGANEWVDFGDVEFWFVFVFVKEKIMNKFFE